MTATQSPGHRDGRAIVVYSAARAGLLAIALVLGWVAGLGGPLLLIVALLVSGVLSWFLLQRPRREMGAAVEERLAGMQRRIGSRTAAEDAYVDALQGTPSRDPAS